GQGIEFDYCSVRAAIALRENDVQSIMINSNPETVSTDFDASTRLYFEPLDEESVESLLWNEGPAAGAAAATASAGPAAAAGPSTRSARARRPGRPRPTLHAHPTATSVKCRRRRPRTPGWGLRS